MKKILLLEDDEILSQTIAQLLVEDGYAVNIVGDGEDALKTTYANNFDLYLLDINVPILNGVDFLKLSRDAGDQTPTFFITALRDIDSLRKAFESGCDDYIKKPFELDELLIRINAKLKKTNPSIEYENIKFDLFENRVYQDGQEVDLRSVEKAIFKLLMQSPMNTVHKSVFFDKMIKPSDSGLRVLINKLRKIFEINIINIKGIGYKLEKL